MNINPKLFTGLFLVVLFSSLALAACGAKTSDSATSAPTTSPAGTSPEGLTLLQDRCGVCHSISRVESQSKTAEQWKTTVERMVNKGAMLNATEQQTLIDYLAQTYP